MAYKSSHKFARIAATKVRVFADLIRGKQAQEGLNLLRYVPNRGARMVEKVLKSAMANAEDRGARNVDHMLIVDARVNNGPMFKRTFPRARGTAYLIRRRFAHIDIAIDAPAAAEPAAAE
jgi:large subunit ribosomal protein L22